jgi:hypothetical protein
MQITATMHGCSGPAPHAPEMQNSLSKGALPKISKTTPCKAAEGPPALERQLDTSGKSVASFHYSEIV